MKISARIWGCRGSLPTAFGQEALDARMVAALAGAGPGDVGSEDAARAYLAEGGGGPRRFGGETTCVEFTNAAGGRIVIDLGTGCRALGLASLAAPPRPWTVLMSHMHWDHIHGFPFFTPAFIPGNRIAIGGGHGGDALREAVLGQFVSPHFPVPAAALGAEFETFDAPPGESFEREGFRVTPLKLRHTGDSYGYRLEHDGASIVFASDAEHDLADIHPEYDYVQWIRGADALIFDGQYGLADLVLHKEDWGHSSGMVGVDLCHLGGVGRLILTHHDPAADDARLTEMEADTREYQDMLEAGGAPPLRVDAAWEGMVVEV